MNPSCRLVCVVTLVLFSVVSVDSISAVPQAAVKPSPVDGFWLGAIGAGNQSLRLQLTVKSDPSGMLSCTAESLDQGALTVPCMNVVLSGDDFSFEIPVVSGRWAGKLSGDGKILGGTWSQAGSSTPLRFDRQAAAQSGPAPRRITFDSAMPPVGAADMQAVLTRDFEKMLKTGLLAPDTRLGVSIGIVRDGERQVFSFGIAKVDSIFEIGSITKTFTGLLLSQIIAQRKVKLETPVRELLPPGTAAKPQGAEITLLDLVTQHSGLPRMPDNIRPADPNNPYADYRPANLYEYFSRHGVGKPAGAGFLYSNLGFGLLGQALANQARTTYAELIKHTIIDPLGLKGTTISLTADQQRRFIQGHSGDRPFRNERPWNFDAFAGAGAIRSTAGDMLTYLEANLHPEKSGALSSALVQSHELRADVDTNMRIAFAWLYSAESGEYWHNGGTGGFSSYCFFNPKGNYAGIILVNATLGNGASIADLLGQHVSQRFAGKPALSLAE